MASDALEALPHSSPPLWIPAFAGMTKWGNRGAGALGRPAWPPMHLEEGLPHSSPPLWIPAFAGMTKWRRRNDEVGRRNDESGGLVAFGKAGLASDAPRNGLPRPSPPLWIPAFAGMTKWGGRNDESGGRRSWQAGLASDALEALPRSPPPLLGGRPSPE